MKFNVKKICTFMSLMVISNIGFAGSMMNNSNKVYIGVFGGGGSSNNFDVSQYGTVFILEAGGGARSVNAFGTLDSQSTAFYGAQLGYEAHEVLLGSNSQWSLTPTAELEGFYMGQSSFDEILFNDTLRSEEIEFDVTLPIKRTVLLTNAILNFNHLRYPVHAFVGLGIGGAIVNIADATAFSPPETNNHFNSNPSDTDTTFAGQIKLGLSYDINHMTQIFAEYRWVYIANTNFTLGSAVAPGHATTSSWSIELDPQQYNLGSVGIRFRF